MATAGVPVVRVKVAVVSVALFIASLNGALTLAFKGTPLVLLSGVLESTLGVDSAAASGAVPTSGKLPASGEVPLLDWPQTAASESKTKATPTFCSRNRLTLGLVELRLRFPA